MAATKAIVILPFVLHGMDKKIVFAVKNQPIHLPSLPLKNRYIQVFRIISDGKDIRILP